RPGDVDPGHFADRLRRLLAEVLQRRRGDPVGRADVEIAGEECQVARRDLAQDRKFDAIEIGPARFPIIRVLAELDVFVWFELDEFKRAGADRFLPHLTRRHVAWVDRRPSRGEERQQPGLWLLKAKTNLVVAIGGDRLDIAVPGLPRIDAQLV